MSNQGTLPCNMSGLDDLRFAAQRYGLEYLWNDFESRIPDLFADETTESRVGKAIDGRNHVEWAITREELLDTLGKGLCEIL